MARYPGDLSGWMCTVAGPRSDPRPYFLARTVPPFRPKNSATGQPLAVVQLCFNDGIWGIAAAKAVDLERRSLGPFSEYFFNDLQAG
jgi:hypothetical protein